MARCCAQFTESFWSQWSLTFEVRKRPPMTPQRTSKFTSQWSLTFEVRKRVPRAGRAFIVDVVAMEPDL